MRPASLASAGGRRDPEGGFVPIGPLSLVEPRLCEAKAVVRGAAMTRPRRPTCLGLLPSQPKPPVLKADTRSLAVLITDRHDFGAPGRDS